MKQSNEFKTNFWCGVTAEYKKQSDDWWSVHCRDVNGGNEGRWFKHLTECEEFTAEFKLPENILVPVYVGDDTYPRCHLLIIGEHVVVVSIWESITSKALETSPIVVFA